jgi:DNA-binding NarL/FixJ family response regulator
MGATAEHASGRADLDAMVAVSVRGDDADAVIRIVELLDDAAGFLTQRDLPEDQRAQAADLLITHVRTVTNAEIASVSELRKAGVETRAIFVVDNPSPRNTRRLIDGGANGVILTDQLEAGLVHASRAVLAGLTVTPRVATPRAGSEFLSYREKQVLGMVVMGFTNSEIGARLYLAESTVKSHLSSAFSKLGVRSRSEASAMILDPEVALGAGILAVTAWARSRGDHPQHRSPKRGQTDAERQRA